MTREEAIKTIEFLYPADAGMFPTAKIGVALLFQAIAEEWRCLPTEILTRYADLCIERERYG